MSFLRPHWLGRSLRTLAVLLPLSTLLAAGDEHASPWLTLRVRLEWSGREPETWNGILEVTTGTLTQPTSLGLGADEPGTVWGDDDAVWIRRNSPRSYDGLDVTVTAPREAVLTLNLQATGSGHDQAAEPVQVRMGDLLPNREHVVPLRGSQGRVVIRRAPGDVLAVSIDRPHLIYSPQDVFRATVHALPQDLRERSRQHTLHWRVLRAGGGRPLSYGSQTLSRSDEATVTLPIEFRLPAEEGVYNIRLSTAGRGLSELERLVQVVVLALSSPLHPPATATAERLVDEFDPRTAGKFRKVTAPAALQKWETNLSRWLNVKSRSSSKHPDESLPIPWLAYRLDIERVDRPHRLTAWLPRGVRQHLGVSVLQPNAAGQLLPVGFDSGLIVAGDTRSTAAAEPAGSGRKATSAEADVRHDVLFWPRVRDPIVLVHALSPGEALRIDNIQVFEMAERLPPAVPASPTGQKRLVGPYMNKPLLGPNFGAPEAFDAPSGRSIDGWQTFLTSGQRLVDYLRYEGHNSLMLAVLADGSTLYPSDLLNPSPRFDTGIFASAGQDPMRKDVVELLLRLFHREGLALVPELQFSAPLPRLEQLRASAPAEADGLELVGRDGRSWTEVHTAARTASPYYNPLDPRVQAAVLEVVREFVERYATHSALKGVSFELGRASCLQMPGLEWGYDDRTVARFEHDTRVHVPGPTDQERFAARHEFLTTKARTQWVRWRCLELARFHQQLSRCVIDRLPEAQVFFSGHGLLQSPGDEPHDSAPAEAGEQLLPGQGVDLALHADERQMMFLRPVVHTVHRPLGFLHGELPPGAAIEAAFRGAGRGHLIYQSPVEIRLPDFDEASPWQPAQTWLLAHISWGGLETRKRLLRTLLAADPQALFDGGSMIPLGQEQAARDIRLALAALPAVRFQTCGAATQPLVVRVARSEGQSYLYVVNDSPMAGEASLVLGCPWTSTVTALGRSASPLTLQREGDTSDSRLQLPLAPFDLWCCRIDQPQCDVRQARMVVAQPDLRQLEARIKSLHQALSAWQESPPAALEARNAGFEQPPSKNVVAGWEVPRKGAAVVSDRQQAHGGGAALRLTTTQPPLTIRGDDVTLEHLRPLAISVWLRSEGASRKVKLVVDTEVDGRRVPHAAEVEVGTAWARFELRLPVDAPHATRVRLMIEAIEAGTLWVDDVELATDALGSDELRQITKSLSAVKLACDEQRFSDCWRLLDGHWVERLAEAAPTQPIAAAPARTVQRPRSLFAR